MSTYYALGAVLGAGDEEENHTRARLLQGVLCWADVIWRRPLDSIQHGNGAPGAGDTQFPGTMRKVFPRAQRRELSAGEMRRWVGVVGKSRKVVFLKLPGGLVSSGQCCLQAPEQAETPGSLAGLER